MKIAITGARGSQQAALIPSLLAAGHQINALSRSPQSSDAPELRWVDGDISDRSTLDSLLDGAEVLAFHLPVSDPSYNPIPLLEAAAEKGVSYFLFNASSKVSPEEGEGNAALCVVQKMQQLGLKFLVLEPTLYLENLLLPFLVSGLSQGVLQYPLPAQGFAVNWFATGDIGAIAAAAIAGQVEGTLAATGDAALAGDALAAAIGRGLGKEIRFEPISPEDFGKKLAPLLGEESSATVQGLYQGIAAAPAAFAPWLNPQEGHASTALNYSATSVETWAREVLAPMLAQ